MTNYSILPALIVLAACSGAAEEDRLTDTIENHSARHDPLNAPAPYRPGASPQLAEPPDARSAQAAAAVLRRYFVLIDAGRAAEAAALWTDAQQAQQFARRLQGFGDFEPNIAAPGRIEGAAGSLYVDISLQLLNGGRALSDGTATLRRVNEVPGATAEQLQWRIERITLQPPPVPLAQGFVGRWASDERNCQALAWRFTADSLTTPAGSVCRFTQVREVPGGYDIAATCTSEGPATNDVLKLRFAQSARALLFDSDVIADAGLVRCP